MIWVVSKLEKQHNVLKGNEAVSVWSEAEIIDGKGVGTGRTVTQLLNAPQNGKNGDIFEVLLYEDFLFGQTLICKREC